MAQLMKALPDRHQGMVPERLPRVQLLLAAFGLILTALSTRTAAALVYINTEYGITVVDEASNAVVRQTHVDGYPVLLSRDGKRLYVGATDGSLKVVTASSYHELFPINIEHGPTD